MAIRMEGTENPYIEDVLDKYSSLPNLTMMALGSSYWGPPADALQSVAKNLGSNLYLQNCMFTAVCYFEENH